MIVVIVFAIALLISFLLLYLPVALTAGRAPPMILYFLALGAGFMFVEMAFIKELTFLLGDPVLALSFVLAAILLFSGAGGFVSDRLKANNLKWILALLAAIVLVLAILIYFLVQSIMSLALWIRIVTSVFVILPASFLMGFPFPTAIRLLVRNSAHRAYGWAANGSTSVLTSIVAVQIAMVAGISKLFLAGGLAYVIALAVLFWQSRRSA
jgi:predicted membrane-bound spermidine synthase